MDREGGARRTKANGINQSAGRCIGVKEEIRPIKFRSTRRTERVHVKGRGTGKRERERNGTAVAEYEIKLPAQRKKQSSASLTALLRSSVA